MDIEELLEKKIKQLDFYQEVLITFQKERMKLVYKLDKDNSELDELKEKNKPDVDSLLKNRIRHHEKEIAKIDLDTQYAETLIEELEAYIIVLKGY
jgi:Skp family chaperone for outer membrane proteins